MGASHHYDLIKGGEETKNEQSKRTTSPLVISWWKFALCNLLAACAGAAVLFLIADGLPTHYSSSSNNATTHDAAAAAVVATPALNPSSTSTKITFPSETVEHIAIDADSPEIAVGTILDCGFSPEEARAKGCVYDVMMQDWVPPPCYDGVLTERYLKEGNWTWYADGAGETTIPDDVMRKGEHGRAWMATSYHKAHCVFSWMKIIRALRNNRGISQELLSYDHVMHCAHGALKESSEDQGLGVQAPTNYAKCALYDTWIQDLIPDKHNSTG